MQDHGDDSGCADSMSRYAVVGCSECGEHWVVDESEAAYRRKCPRCQTRYADHRLRRQQTAHSWENAVEMRSAILASKRNAQHEFAEVAHYADLDDQIEGDVPTTETTPDILGNVVSGAELLERYEAAGDLYTPATDRSPSREEIVEELVDRGVETSLTDRERHLRDREELLEIKASAALERHHRPIEYDLADPDDRYDDSGSLRLAAFGQTRLTHAIHGVTPSVASELAEIVDTLIPSTIDAVHRVAEQEGRPVESLHLPPTDEEYGGVNHLAEKYGVSGGNLAFATTVIAAAARPIEDWPDAVRDELRSYGSGQSTEGKHLDGLRHAHVALLQAGGVTPRIQLVLDGPAWTGVEDRRKIERFFDALDVLAKAVDIELVASPHVVRTLTRRVPDIVDEHDLTEGRGGSHLSNHDTDSGDRTEAYHVLDEMNSPGAHRLIANVFQDEPRTVKELKSDEEIDLAASTVDRYVRQLEGHDLLAVAEYTTRSNAVTLTQFGKIAKGLITPSYDLLPPEQQSLPSEPYRPPKSLDKYSVSNADRVEEGGARLSPEEWLAATGDPSSTGGFVQWMDGRGADLDAFALHERHTAAIQGDGITLLDAPVHEMDDPRVTYLSVMRDQLHAVTQWGGSRATLGRIAAALSGAKIWGKALSEDALEEVLSDFGSTPEEVLSFLRRGMQIGWLNAETVLDEDGVNYYELRDALFHAGRDILGRLSDTEQSSDERSKFYRDCHGLITSMTALLDHVGIETSIHLRFPDSSDLIANDDSRHDLVDFLTYTAPKQSRYGVHSGYRQVVEDRDEKLKFRLPMDVDRINRTADLTASWVVAGEGMDELTEDVLSGLDSVSARNSVANGDEESIGIKIPVHTGGTTGQARHVIRELLREKDWNPDSQDIDRVTRVLMSLLSHKFGRVSPYLVADVLLGMSRNTRGYDVDLRDLRAGLARVSEADIYPTLKPTISKMTAALLQADGHLEAAELVTAAGISRRSYETHIDTLRDLDVFARDADGWFPTVEPWWASPSRGGRDEPSSAARTTNSGDTILPLDPSTVDEVVGEVARSLAWRGCLDVNIPEIAVQCAADHGRQPTVAEWCQHIPDIAGWLPVIESLWPDGDLSQERTDSNSTGSLRRSVLIGQADDSNQASLTTSVAPAAASSD